MNHAPRVVLGALLLLLATVVSVDAAVDVPFTITDQKGQPVADAVVSLVPLDASAATPVPATKSVEIQQKGQEFSPYVTAITVGTAVAFPNRDTVQHHVYSLSKPKKFELPLYAGEAKAPVVFDRPGVVALGCNIHDWMAAYVVVLPTSWFAKTTADGRATIAQVPPGRYRAEAWHPRLSQPQSREVLVADAAATSQAFTLTLKADRRITRHATQSAGY